MYGGLAYPPGVRQNTLLRPYDAFPPQSVLYQNDPLVTLYHPYDLCQIIKGHLVFRNIRMVHNCW